MKRVIYMDEKGRPYKVQMEHTGEWKAKYYTPGRKKGTGWRAVSGLQWRATEDEAQADLNKYAEKKGLTAVKAL